MALFRRNNSYPWDLLKNPGDSFTWEGLSDEVTLRSQAHKKKRIYGALFSVRKDTRARHIIVTFVGWENGHGQPETVDVDAPT